jgi:hypothetical protein
MNKHNLFGIGKYVHVIQNSVLVEHGGLKNMNVINLGIKFTKN